MAQNATLLRTVGDSFREVADFFDRFPSLTDEVRYPDAPMKVHFLAARAEQVEALASVFDKHAQVRVDPITGDTTTVFTVDFGHVHLDIFTIDRVGRELHRPAVVTELLAERDV